MQPCLDSEALSRLKLSLPSRWLVLKKLLCCCLHFSRCCADERAARSCWLLLDKKRQIWPLCGAKKVKQQEMDSGKYSINTDKSAFVFAKFTRTALAFRTWLFTAAVVVVGQKNMSSSLVQELLRAFVSIICFCFVSNTQKRFTCNYYEVRRM